MIKLIFPAIALVLAVALGLQGCGPQPKTLGEAITAIAREEKVSRVDVRKALDRHSGNELSDATNWAAGSRSLPVGTSLRFFSTDLRQEGHSHDWLEEWLQNVNANELIKGAVCQLASQSIHTHRPPTPNEVVGAVVQQDAALHLELIKVLGVLSDVRTFFDDAQNQNYYLARMDLVQFRYCGS